MPDLSIEQQYPKQLIAGVDEVGRGCLAGPVVACAVILKENAILPGVDDSKKLSAKKRKAIVDIILKNALAVGVGVVDVNDIDDINILNATKLAMKKAVEHLDHRPNILLIDGDSKQKLDISIQQQFIIKGDSISLSIASASILAKELRDRLMTELSKQYPEYGWDKNAGYGTKQHLDALKKVGYTKYHRHSFAPLKEHINDYERRD